MSKKIAPTVAETKNLSATVVFIKIHPHLKK
jgi:hypothetical protein